MRRGADKWGSFLSKIFFLGGLGSIFMEWRSSKAAQDVFRSLSNIQNGGNHDPVRVGRVINGVGKIRNNKPSVGSLENPAGFRKATDQTISGIQFPHKNEASPFHKVFVILVGILHINVRWEEVGQSDSFDGQNVPQNAELDFFPSADGSGGFPVFLHAAVEFRYHFVGDWDLVGIGGEVVPKLGD